jgi:hypothetical protein
MKRFAKLVALAGLSAGILLSISCHSTKLDQREQIKPEGLNTNDVASIVKLLTNPNFVAISTLYRPRTLDEKVKEAELIVVGTATAFGDERVMITNFFGGTQPPLLPDNTNSIFPKPADRGVSLYERNLRVNISEVLWPPSASQTNVIIFPYYILKTWPESSWNYSNTPGVFFLIGNKHPEQSEWTMLDRYNDWMEPETNAQLVRASIKKQRR